jgi:hypothetical protein
MKMTFQEIRIIATIPCIANQLRDVNTICRRSWYIAAHVWKIYDFKIEVVPLIINFSTELTTVVKFEVNPRFLCRLTALIKLLVAVQRRKVLYTETIEFASPSIGSAHFHVSWLSDFIFYHKP